MIVANIELRPNKFNDLKTNATFKKQISSGKVISKERPPQKKAKNKKQQINEFSWKSHDVLKPFLINNFLPMKTIQNIYRS